MVSWIFPSQYRSLFQAGYRTAVRVRGHPSDDSRSIFKRKYLSHHTLIEHYTNLQFSSRYWISHVSFDLFPSQWEGLWQIFCFISNWHTQLFMCLPPLFGLIAIQKPLYTENITATFGSLTCRSIHKYTLLPCTF